MRPITAAGLSMTSLLKAAQHAVTIAEQHITATAPTAIRDKADKDPVTDVDDTIEDLIRTYLAAHTPGIAFVGEEHGGDDHTRTRWLLDPVDGTVNFWRGLPLFGISLALIQDDRPVIGVISLPAFGRRYWAGAGLGAYRDGTPISTSRTTALDHAVVAVGDYGTGPTAPAYNQASFTLHQQLAPAVRRIRMLGSAAADLALVADGTLDASLTLSNQPWDMAAGTIIARQAGALVLDRDGSPHTFTSANTIAVTPGLRESLLATIHPENTLTSTPAPGTRTQK